MDSSCKVEVGERGDMQLSKGYRLEYGDSKDEIPHEVVFSEEGESLRLDLKSEEDMKSLVENCSGSEGTYLDEVQEDNVAEEREISLDDQQRLSDKDVEKTAAASVIIPLRDAPNEEDLDSVKRLENGSLRVHKQGLGERVEIEGGTGEGDQQDRVFDKKATFHGHILPGSTPKETSGSGMKYEETEASLSVPPVKRDDHDDGTKFPKFEGMSFSPGFLWKTGILFLTFSVAVVNVASGKVIHIDGKDNVVKERSTNEQTNMIHVYKSLEAGEECSAGKQAIQDKCNGSEQAVCVRNRTLKNLVALCAPNIYIHGFCPVFTLATSNGSTFTIVQFDVYSQCLNCTDYNLQDIEKYPQCLKLEMDESTAATSSSNATSYSAGRDKKGLSGGSIAAIVTGAIIVSVVITVVVLFFLHKSDYIHIQSERLCQIWGQITGWIFVNENSDTEKDTELSSL